MPGKEPRKRKYAKGHNPLGDDIMAHRFVTKDHDAHDDEGVDGDERDGAFLIPSTTTSKILKAARQQLQDDDQGGKGMDLDDETGMFNDQMDVDGEDVNLDDAEEEEVELEYDETESQATEVPGFADDQDAFHDLDDDEMRLLEKFQPPSSMQARNLSEIIMEKIREKELLKEQGKIETMSDDGSVAGPRIDHRVVKVYNAIGGILRGYTSGKIPKAFKILPHVNNWEQLLMLTRPYDWSPHAVYAATRIFAAGLNEKMAQRFYNAILLPIIHSSLRTNKKLHPAMYNALRKALFKPVAFFKGFLLPLCDPDTECSLREALVIASILQKMHLPTIQTAVVMVKISQLPFNGVSTVFLRVLIDKKMALPYQAIDALVAYFYRFVQSHPSTEKLPVLWHQSFLSFVTRYKGDFTPEQLELLQKVCSKHFHHCITPEVRRELAVSQGKVSSLH